VLVAPGTEERCQSGLPGDHRGCDVGERQDDHRRRQSDERDPAPLHGGEKRDEEHEVARDHGQRNGRLSFQRSVADAQLSLVLFQNRGRGDPGSDQRCAGSDEAVVRRRGQPPQPDRNDQAQGGLKRQTGAG
jgi:hypothetical protein